MVGSANNPLLSVEDDTVRALILKKGGEKERGSLLYNGIVIHCLRSSLYYIPYIQYNGTYGGYSRVRDTV